MWMMLLGNVWVRRAAMVVGVLLLLLMVRQHYVDLGEHKGEQKQQATTADENEQSRAGERRDVLAELTELRGQIAALDARGQALAGVALKSAATAQAAAMQQTAAIEGVAAVPAADLHAHNVQALAQAGIAAAKGAGYSDEEERAIAGCLAERPLCEQKAAALGDANAALKEQAEDAGKARDLEQQEYQSLAQYTGDLEKDYAQLYNAVPRGRNWAVSVLTLGLKGKAKKLGVPSVGELKGIKARD